MSTTSPENAGELSPPSERFGPLPFSRSFSEVAANYAPKTMLTDKDLRHILAGVETALDVFGNNEGKLNALEISLKSMLIVVQRQIETELASKEAVTILPLPNDSEARTLA